MPWTTPRTWTTSEVVTAAMMNTHVRDNENWLNTFHGCLLWKSVNQTVPSGNNDLVTWDSEVFDTDALHNTVTNNSRITIPSGLDGYWRFTANIATDTDATNHNNNIVRLRKNAAGVPAGGTLLAARNFTTHNTNAGSQPLDIVANLVATDHVEIFNNAVGEARDVVGGDSTLSILVAAYLGV